ncbi:MAG: HPr family phosphocarrier protein [Planctomycetaceae bacterium]|nr:HPr family phosphocarrier protein [Planctomycetaceae bacterium]
MTQVHRARVRLVNSRGLHARPCHAVVTTALAHAARLVVRCEGRQADGRSILSLMTLGAAHGSELELEAEGEGAEALLAALTQLFAAGFSELD